MRQVPRPYPRRDTSRHTATYGTSYRRERERVLATTPEVCAICGEGPRPGAQWKWETDHTVSAVDGGGHAGNLRRTHRYCNRRKGGQTGVARTRQRRA